MKEPGGLSALGEAGSARWSERVERCVRALADEQPLGEHARAAPDERTSEVTAPDWGGFPVRIARCLSHRRAWELLDWRGERGDEGRLRAQEEYLEWRVVRDADGAIQRVELTTELADYWRVLAACEPERTLELVAEVAREDAIPPEAVYGSLDPFAAGVSADERERAFAATMLPADADGPYSPYNDGRSGICCMVQPTNTLGALVALAARAAAAYVVEDEAAGGLRPASAAEVIPELDGAAQAGRSSDPVVIERLARLGFEGRYVALDDPIGVYIQGVEHARLRRRDGGPVPAKWFTLGRGVGPEAAADGRARHRRLVLEAPPDAGIRVDDLIDVATEEPIAHGGQIADLVQLAVFVRTSPPDAVAVEPRRLASSAAPPDIGCDHVRNHYEDFRRSAEPLTEGR